MSFYTIKQQSNTRSDLIRTPHSPQETPPTRDHRRSHVQGQQLSPLRVAQATSWDCTRPWDLNISWRRAAVTVLPQSCRVTGSPAERGRERGGRCPEERRGTGRAGGGGGHARMPAGINSQLAGTQSMVAASTTSQQRSRRHSALQKHRPRGKTILLLVSRVC